MDKKQGVIRKPSSIKVGSLKQDPDEIKIIVSVLKDLMEVKKLSKYHTTFQKVCDLIPNLIDKARRMEKQVLTLRDLVAPKESSGDSAVLEDKLKIELERAWITLDECYDREEKSAQTISELKMKIADLEAEKGSAESMSLRREVADELRKENEHLKKRVKFLEGELKNKKELEKKWEAERGDLTKKLSKSTKAMDSLKTKLDQESKKKTELEREVQKLSSSSWISSRTPRSTESISSQRGSTIKFQRALGSRTKLVEEDSKEINKCKQKACELERELTEKDGIIRDLMKRIRSTEESSERLKKNEETVRKETECLKDQLVAMQEKIKSEVSRQRETDFIKKKNEALEKKLRMMESELSDKSNVISEFMKLKDHFRIREEEMHNKIVGLNDELTSKDSENKNLDRAVIKLTEEIRKYHDLVSQMEQSRDRYIQEVELLESKICELEGKVAEMDPENYPQGRRISRPSSAKGSRVEEVTPDHDEDVKDAMIRIADEEIRRLNDDIVEKEREMEKMQLLMDQQRRLLEEITKYAAGDNAGNEKQFTDEVAIPKHFPFDGSRTAMISFTAQLIHGSSAKRLQLLKEKVQILEEVIKRGAKPFQPMSTCIYSEDSSQYSDLIRIAGRSDNVGAEHDAMLSGNGQDMDTEERDEKLLRRVEELESLLQTKTREISEKDECLKSQFEIIDELKKCVSVSEQDNELEMMSHRMEKQQKLVAQLKEKSELYESYIKDYQEEIRTLTERLREAGVTSSPAWKQFQREPQNRLISKAAIGLSLADSAKKQKSGWQKKTKVSLK